VAVGVDVIEWFFQKAEGADGVEMQLFFDAQRFTV
jgi:hypothetical protein